MLPLALSLLKKAGKQSSRTITEMRIRFDFPLLIMVPPFPFDSIEIIIFF